MNKTAADNPDAADWLTPLLLQDAQRDTDTAPDAAFVANVLARLDAPPAVLPPVAKARTDWAQGRGLLLGYALLVAVFLGMAAPSAMQAWLRIAQAPLNTGSWHDPNVWGFMVGVGMLVYGLHELMNLPEAHLPHRLSPSTGNP